MADEETKEAETDKESTASEEAAEAPAGKDDEGGASAAAGDDAADGANDEGDEAEEAEDDKALTQASLAERVGRLSPESDEERDARLEEERLAARRAKSKGKKGKKRGLEAAASKKLASIGAKSPSRKRAAVATAVDADPLMEKTQQFSKWVQENTRVVAAVVGLLIVGGIAFGGYSYLQKKKESDASALLADAVADERGRIGDPDKEDDEDKPKDPTPIFKTVADRREAALAKYQDVVGKYAGTGAAYLARLAEGSLYLDKEDPDKAIAAYDEVLASPLAQADSEVKGRAMEGLGFAHELKAAKGDKDKELDEALKQFRALENTDVKGFKELGMYHQARVYETKGDKDKAKELLKSLWERINKPGEGHPFPYLQTVAEDRLRALDPTALPPKPTGMMGNAPGGNKQLDEAQIKKLIEQLQKQAKEHPEAPGK